LPNSTAHGERERGKLARRGEGRQDLGEARTRAGARHVKDTYVYIFLSRGVSGECCAVVPMEPSPENFS